MLSEEIGLEQILAAFSNSFDALLLFDSVISWKQINNQSMKEFLVFLIKESFLPSSLESLVYTALKKKKGTTVFINKQLIFFNVEAFSGITMVVLSIKESTEPWMLSLALFVGRARIRIEELESCMLMLRLLGTFLPVWFRSK